MSKTMERLKDSIIPMIMGATGGSGIVMQWNDIFIIVIGAAIGAFIGFIVNEGLKALKPCVFKIFKKK